MIIAVAVVLVFGIFYIGCACVYDVVFGGTADVRNNDWDWS